MITKEILRNTKEIQCETHLKIPNIYTVLNFLLLYYVHFVVNFSRMCLKQQKNNPIILLPCMICHM